MEKRWRTYRAGVRRAAVLALAGTLLWRPPFPAFATSKAEREKKEAQRGLDEANQKAEEAREKMNSAQSEVAALSDDLAALIADITLLEADIEYKNEQIRQAQSEYDAAKTREEEQYESMKKRIKYMYEKGDTEYLDILLQVKSMTELLNKSEYIEALYTHDREKLNEFQDTKLAVKQYKGQLETEKAEMEGMQLEYADQQAQLETTIAQKRKEIANFDEQLASAKEAAAAYTAAIAKKNEEIRQAEAEARRRAEAQRQAEAQRLAAAQRQQAEEASRAAAQASAAAAESLGAASAMLADNQGGGISGNQAPTAGASNFTEAPPLAVQPETKAGAPGPGASQAPATTAAETKPVLTSASSKGQDVVNFAMQFIGCPYVYGGTSLTNGADCSGFVQSVYKNFGVSLPRSSSQQRSAGTAVDYANAQPGDIICYSGHVGIYIGNGQIVHASSPSTGIKVGNATYRSILSVRRIFN